jgi:hypothetical protein
MAMKEHTIVEPWPTSLKLSRKHSGAQKEFDIAMVSGHSGCERYVEWKRVN